MADLRRVFMRAAGIVNVKTLVIRWNDGSIWDAVENTCQLPILFIIVSFRAVLLSKKN